MFYFLWFLPQCECDIQSSRPAKPDTSLSNNNLQTLTQMESHPSNPHNNPKACYKTESRSKNQHQEATLPPGTRGGNGSFWLKKGEKSIDSPMQTKTPASTVIPTTLVPASATASPATSRTHLVQAATAPSITSTTILTTEIPDKHAAGITQSTTLTSGTRGHKIKCSREGELETSDKNSSKNIHKTTSQISASTDLQKSLQKTSKSVVTRTALPKSVQQASFTQIRTPSPKLKSSPTPTIAVDQAENFRKGRSIGMVPSLAHELKSNDNGACVMEVRQEVHSVQPLGTKQGKVEMLQRNKDEEKNRGRKEEEDILKYMDVGRTLKGSEITLQVASKCPPFPLDRLQLSPGATTTSASQVKETAGKTDENAMAQETECEREKLCEWKESMEGGEALEKRSGHEGRDQEKKTEEKERKGQDRNSEAKKKEREDREMEEAIQEKKLNQNQSFKDAAIMTEEHPVPVHTLDAALQTELLYEDAEIQAVVEVSNKYTTMSPNMTHPSWSQIDPKANLSNHEKASGTASTSLQNGLSQDVTLDSGLAPITLASVGSMAKSLSPTHYKSSISCKRTRQHVCQIQIELCSQSTLSDSLALPEEEDSTRSGLEKEPKQVDREGDQAETGPIPEVAWDEQGMTWEVYGAAVDMESLGFAIQNHLQHKIQENEQRIGHLRKSISLSEHSKDDGNGARKKKKSNVFRSLFQRPTCCLKTESEA